MEQILRIVELVEAVMERGAARELPCECHWYADLRELYGAELGCLVLPDMIVEYVYDPTLTPDPALCAWARFRCADYLLFWERERGQWWFVEVPPEEDTVKWWAITPSEAYRVIPALTLTTTGRTLLETREP